MGCMWYETACLEKKCNGEGVVVCRIKEKGAVSSRLEREYKKVTLRTSQVTRVPCLSCLEKEANNSRGYISA